MYSACLLHDLDKEFVTINNSSEPPAVPSAEADRFIPGLAVWRVKYLPGEHGGGWFLGEAEVPGLGGEKGIRASPASPAQNRLVLSTVKFELRSSRY